MTRKITTFVALASLIVAVKLFTCVIYAYDDPTVYFTVRDSPSLTNRFHASKAGGTPKGYLLLASDENQFVGGGLYFSFVDWGWIIALATAATPAIVCDREVA